MMFIFKQHPIALFFLSLSSLFMNMNEVTQYILPKSIIISGVSLFFHPIRHRDFCCLLAASALLTATILLKSPFSTSHLSIEAPKLQMQRKATSFVCQESVSLKHFLYGYRESVSKTYPFWPIFNFQIVI